MRGRSMLRHAGRALGPSGMALVAVVVGVAGAGAVALTSHDHTSARAAVAAGGATPTTGATAAASQSRQVGASDVASVSQRLPAPPVAKLGALSTPDVQVTAAHRVTRAQLSALLARHGVKRAVVLDQSTLRVGATTMHAIGVDPSAFRGWTPRLTAASDPLWRSVAAGEMTVSFSHAATLKKLLGQDLPVTAGRPGSVRLGAFAAIGLTGTDVVVSHDRAAKLGFAMSRGLLVAAPGLSLSDLTAAVKGVLGGDAHVELLRPASVDQAQISSYASGKIPASYLRLYRAAAATCPGMPWTVLAAIGGVETGHGSTNAVSSAGAMGPMQFLPSTFKMYGVDGNGDGIADINNPADAIYSAARYLCASGAGRGGQSLYDAIFSYNHADWYVRKVLALAEQYA